MKIGPIFGQDRSTKNLSLKDVLKVKKLEGQAFKLPHIISPSGDVVWPVQRIAFENQRNGSWQTVLVKEHISMDADNKFKTTKAEFYIGSQIETAELLGIAAGFEKQMLGQGATSFHMAFEDPPLALAAKALSNVSVQPKTANPSL